MNKGVLKDETKPILVRGEKTRYRNSAQYFIDGGNKFYENYAYEVKQMVDIQTMRSKAMSALSERVDDVKKSIQEKIEKVKNRYKNGFGDFLINTIEVLEKSVIGLYFFGDKLKTIYDEHKLYVFQFLKKLKEVAFGSVSHLKDFFDFSLNYGEEVVVQLGEIITKIGGIFGKFVWNVLEIVWAFFNRGEGNVFIELLQETGKVAAMRANGIIGLIMELLSDKIDRSIRKRPILKNYFKFGAGVVYNISEVEGSFRELDTFIDTTIGIVRRRKQDNLVKQVYEPSNLISHFNEISESIIKNFDEEIRDYDTNNILSELKWDEETPIKKMKSLHIEDEKSGIDKKFLYGSGLSAARLKDFDFIIKKPEVLTNSENKIKDFLKRYENFDNSTVNEIRSEWEEYNKEGQSDVYKYIMIRPLLYTVLVFDAAQQIKEFNLNDYSKYETLYDKIHHSTQKNEVTTLIDDYFGGFVDVGGFFSKLVGFLSVDKMFVNLMDIGLIRKFLNIDDTLVVLRERRDISQRMHLMYSDVSPNNIYFISEDNVLNQYSALIKNYRSSEVVDENDSLVASHIGEKQGINMVQMVQMMVDGYVKLRVDIKKKRQRRAWLLSLIRKDMDVFPKEKQK